jgi:hypothetical protein
MLCLGALCLAAAGCGDRKPKAPEAEKQTTVKDAVDRATKAIPEALAMRDEADTKFIETAIQAYNASEGRLPESLDAIPEVRQRGLDTSRWVYEPASGKVYLKTAGR